MTELDNEFQYYLRNMSCQSVLKLPYAMRCSMAKQVLDCIDLIYYFDYFKMMYCILNIHDKWLEYLTVCLFVVLILSYLVLMSIVVDLFFTPLLKVLSIRMHLSEQVAGCTLLVFGNSAPDLVSNLMPVRTMSKMFTSTVSSCVVEMLLCGGMACYMKPFRIDGHSMVRDLLFLMLGLELLRLIMYTGHSISLSECLVFLSIYVIYLLVIIVDLKLIRHTIRKLRREIEALKQQESSPERNLELQKRVQTLQGLRQHDAIGRRPDADADDEGTGPIYIDIRMTERMFYKELNDKNHLIWQDMLDSLNPIDMIDWQTGNHFQRFIMLVKAPILLVVTLLVPIVDYERNKHGWCKLLNCIHMAVNPFLLMTAVHSKLIAEYSSWHIDLHFEYSRWSLCLTLPMALYMWLNTRTDLPPDYHFLFIILNICSCLMIIAFCVNEIEVLACIVGAVFNLSDNFTDITFGSLANATINMLATLTTVSQGYERMAFAAAIANPFFNVVMGIGLSLLFNSHLRASDNSFWVQGEHGETCYIFLLISVVCTLWWSLTLNFHARRSVGIFSLIIFVLFLIYAVAIETEFAHEFTANLILPPR